jgi:diguanylate cyclase (GGDEF)-like protein
MDSAADGRHPEVSPQRSSRRRIVALTATLWSISVAIMAASYGPQNWGAAARWQPLLAFAVLTACFVLVEVFVVHLRIRTDAHTFSLVELPLAIGLFFASPWALIAAQLVGGGLALRFHRKQNALKLAFNLGSFAFSTSIAVTVLHAIAPNHDALETTHLLAGALTLMVAAVASTLTVWLVISISTGSWKFAELRSDTLFGLFTAVFTSSLGVIAVVVIDAQPSLAWMLAIPTAGIYIANWAYTTQRRRHEGLDFLYQSAQLLHQTQGFENAIADLLRHTCRTFNAGAAELVYLTESGDQPVCIRVGPDGVVDTMQVLDDRHRRALDLVTAGGTRLVRPGGDGPEAAYLMSSGYRNAIIAPLQGEVRVAGVLVIANRLSDVVGFDANDARLAETLASHTTTALENGRLEQSLEQLRVLEGQLTFQALHDPLTGLANRTLFRNELASAIDEGRGALGAVLFIDLDDFKTVNDSFGHAAGDALLIEVASRLQAALPTEGVIARLGGDEFAVLLPDVRTLDESVAIAEQVLHAFHAPAIVAQRRLAIRASIGIATIEPATDPETMMRNADTAMYTAKAQGKHRVVSFEPAMYETNVHRFNLTSDLQRALAHREFTVVFQPIVRMSSHELLGAEALVRWNHPTFGLLTPDSFIPIAEQAGLMAAVDEYVMERSCEWLASLDRSDPGLVPWVNVNMSPRSFQQENLVEKVSATLRRHQLTPNRLGIEITENLMSQQADEAISTLHQLKRLGIRLALDDFGTGYSSLSYLHSLPVDVVKIAKQFIDDLEESRSQRAFTTAIVALGAALDKFVVAEGVEREEQLGLLEAAGCGGGQGFVFAPGLSADEFLEWARSRPARSGVTPLSVARQRRAAAALNV